MTIANERVRVTVNGVTYERSVEPRLLLSDFLRTSSVSRAPM
jgi:aerobic-type carbon monoxide dehydrogenase small subunit (CoxS/CutS family)